MGQLVENGRGMVEHLQLYLRDGHIPQSLQGPQNSPCGNVDTNVREDGICIMCPHAVSVSVPHHISVVVVGPINGIGFAHHLGTGDAARVFVHGTIWVPESLEVESDVVGDHLF